MKSTCSALRTALAVLFSLLTSWAQAVTITADPQPLTRVAGDLAVFTVQATGTGTLSYQWRKDGANIIGATQQALVLNPITAADAADYSVVVTDAVPSSATSASAALTVSAPTNGDLDFSFGGSSINGAVNAVAVQSDGKVLIGGDFTTAGGAVRSRIARLNADGSTDFSFGDGLDGANGSVYAVAVQSDGKVLIGGEFTTVHGATRNCIARLNSDGTLDTSFGNGLAGANDIVYAVAVQSDGKVLIGGSFTTVNGTTIHRIAGLNSDGTLDMGFGNGLAGANGHVIAVAAQSDGKVLIGGPFTTVNGTVRNGIARLNGDGTLDTGFGNGLTGANNPVLTVAVQSDGKVLIGGFFTTVNGTPRNRIARLNDDGTLDTDFGNGLTGATDAVRAVAVQSDGRVLIGGNFWSVNGTPRNGIARLNSDGTLDTGFGDGLAGANGHVIAVAVQSDGKVLIGGFFTTINGTARNYIAKLNSDGTLDTGFGNGLVGANTIVWSLAAQSDGKVLIGGEFTTVNGTPRNYIARLNSDGTLDTGFGNGLAGANTIVWSLAAQSDGKVLIGGDFSSVNGAPRNGIARLNSDGTLDTGFGNGLAGANNRVGAVAVQSDGKVLIGGSFSQVNGTPRDRYARLIGAAPTVTSVIPGNGAALGGTSVTLTGSGFTGATAVTFGGTNAFSFTVDSDTQITATTPAYEEGAVSVIVTTSEGANAIVTIFTYTAPSSRINLVGNSKVIVNEATTPDEADGSDFGSVSLLNTQVTRVFTISNSGDLPLNLFGTALVEIIGAHAEDFAVTTFPAPSIAVGESTSLAITFDPSQPGQRTALVSIANDDPDRDPFTFVVGGFGGLGRLLGQNIAFTVPGTVFLGEGPITLLAEASSGLPVSLEVVSGPGTLVGSVLTPSGAGKVTVRARQAGGGNYAPAKSVTPVITVKADPGVLTLTGLSQRYDGTAKQIGTVGVAGSVEVSYQVGGVFGPAAPTEAGRYAVRAVADEVTRAGTLVITKAPLYVVPQDERKFAGEVNPGLSLVYEGFIGGDTEAVLTSVPVLATAAKVTSPGGVYPITARGGAAANYALIYRQGTLVVESFAAGYEALLVDGLVQLFGKLSLTVAKSGRSFSGSMALVGETKALRVSGPLVTDSTTEMATAAASVVRNGVTYAVDVTLPMYGEVTGAVTRDSLALATLSHGQRLLALPKGGKVTYSGAHTAVLESAVPSGADVPAGAGWARATINTRGAIALAGRLGDGTTFTTSMLPDGEPTPGYRLWVQPYKPARVESFLGGQFAVSQHPSLSRSFVKAGAELTWVKAERAADKSYPLGFVPLTVGLKLDPWIKPTAAAPLATLLGLSGDSFTVQHSATGSDSHGDLPATLTLSARNVVSVSGGSNPTNWKTKLNTGNGTFTGSFELFDVGVRRVVPFSGVLRQPTEASDEVIGDGHFLLPQAGEVRSGEVLFLR